MSTKLKNADRRLPVRYHNCAFGDAGKAADPEQPKASEGMEKYRERVEKALDAAGWSAWSNPNPIYDFVIQELYVDCVIVVDYRTGKYYRIPLLDDGETTVLDTPELYDITFTPAEKKPEEETPAAADATGKAAASQVVLGVSRETGEDGVVVNAYEILIMSSGFTCDGRYFTNACAEDAFEHKLFDGVTCYYQHPGKDDKSDGSMAIRRDNYMCAYVKPGSCTIKTNAAGLRDIYGTAVIVGTDPGRNVDIILAASLNANLPPDKSFLRNSIYGMGDAKIDKIEGRQVQVFTKLHSIDAVDFVEFAAFPRAGVKQKVAAQQLSAEDTTMTADELKEEIAKLKAKNEDLKEQLKGKSDEVAANQHEKNVDAALAASNLPQALREVQRPIMLMMTTFSAENLANYVKAQEAMTWKDGKRPPVDGAADKDTDPTAPPPLPAEAQAAFNAIIKVGEPVSPEMAAAARKDTFVNVGI